MADRVLTRTSVGILGAVLVVSATSSADVGPGVNENAPAESSADAPVEVVVSEALSPTTAAAVRLTPNEVRTTPAAFGDAFRAIETLPGFTPIISGVPYFQLRGAPVGTTGYYVDEVPVPLLFHFGVGPGVLQSTFVSGVDVYPGAYPARLGSWVGGVVVGTLNPLSDSLEPRGTWSARLLDAGASLESPFANGAGQVRVGGRYGYPGLALSLLQDSYTLSYWDYNVRSRYALSSNTEVEVLWFGANDYLGERVDPLGGSDVWLERLRVQFHRVDARFTRYLPNGTLRLAATGGYDTFGVGEALDASSTMASLRARLDLAASSTVRIESGLVFRTDSVRQSIYETPLDASRKPNVSQKKSPELGDDDFPIGIGNRRDADGSAYFAVDWSPTSRVQVSPGLRADIYSSGSHVSFGFDPRLRARFRITPQLALVNAVGVSHQRPSLGPLLPGGVPTLKGGLQRAYHHSAGAELALSAWQLNGSLFQHWYDNATDYAGVPDPEENLRTTAHAYGLELLLRRRFAGNWGAQLSYTLSRTTRASGTVDRVALTDRPHVFNAGLVYRFWQHWLFSAKAIAYSGVLPEPEPDMVKARRTSPFWRLDWRLERQWVWGRRNVSLIFEVLNTTANTEQTGWYCERGSCAPEVTGPVLAPSVGLEGRF